MAISIILNMKCGIGLLIYYTYKHTGRFFMIVIVWVLLKLETENGTENGTERSGTERNRTNQRTANMTL